MHIEWCHSSGIKSRSKHHTLGQIHNWWHSPATAQCLSCVHIVGSQYIITFANDAIMCPVRRPCGMQPSLISRRSLSPSLYAACVTDNNSTVSIDTCHAAVSMHYPPIWSIHGQTPMTPDAVWCLANYSHSSFVMKIENRNLKNQIQTWQGKAFRNYTCKSIKYIGFSIARFL